MNRRPGDHNFFRGGALATYDRETRDAIAALRDPLAAAVSLHIWERALASAWTKRAVWVHGDVAALVPKGSLAAVMDFGCCGGGDSACDLTITWTLFTGASRSAFRQADSIDEDTRARARGWALWKALILLNSKGQPTEGYRTLNASFGKRFDEGDVLKNRQRPIPAEPLQLKRHV